jgi:TolB-like protein/Tfp pilus assembly protein PilF
VRTIIAYRTAMTNVIQQYRGRVVDSPGDNILAEFTSVVDAVNCAVEIQRELAERNAELPENRRMQFRIGINLGDVLEEGERIYGDGVNIAARMETLAEAGEICISGTVYDAVESKIGLEYEFLGEHEVKNIDKPIRAYRVLSYPGAAAHRVVKAKEAVGRSWRNAIVVIAVVLVVGAAVAVWQFYFRAPPMEPVSEKDMVLPLPDKPSLAVLPFANIGDRENEYIADGITEQIITALARNPSLFVIASNSTFTYKGKPVMVQQVSRELGVRYVVEGSAQRSGDRIRITAQLIDATRGEHIWAENFDRELKDIFALQDEIVIEILEVTMGKLAGYGEHSREKGTANVEAYLKYLKAVPLTCRNEPNNRQAQQLFEESIALDPEFAIAYSALGISYCAQAMNGWSQSPGKDLKRAFDLAQKAISLDQALEGPHVTLGWFYLLQGKHDEAVAEGRKAVAIAPNSAFANYELGAFLAYADQPEEAISVSQNALRLNPFPSDWQLWFLGTAYSVAGRDEEALKWYKKAEQRNPDNMWSYSAQASIYGNLGRKQAARAAAKKFLRLNPKFSLVQYEKAPWQKNREKWKLHVDGLRKAGIPETPPLPLPDKPSIAVLPFVNMSGDPEQEYFSDGISEEIITALSKIRGLFVIARTSSFRYKDKEVDIRRVGRELGVRYVLEGSVRKEGEKLRLTAQLIDAQTNNHLWAERYDRDLKDIFAIQDDLTKKIITAMQVKLTSGELALNRARGTDNLKAYLKYLEGQNYRLRGNKEDNIRARRMFEEVIAQDPNFAAGYEELAFTHMMEIPLGISKSPRQSIATAIKLTQKALELDDSLASAHALLGWLYTMTRQHDKGIAECEQAIALGPNSAACHFFMGTVLRYAGRPEEGIPFFKQAIRLSPFPPATYFSGLGMNYCLTGNHQESIKACRKAVDANPKGFYPRVFLTAVYSVAGQEEEARAEATEVIKMNPQFLVESWAKTMPFKNRTHLQMVIGSLRKAGLK